MDWTLIYVWETDRESREKGLKRPSRFHLGKMVLSFIACWDGAERVVRGWGIQSRFVTSLPKLRCLGTLVGAALFSRRLANAMCTTLANEMQAKWHKLLGRNSPLFPASSPRNPETGLSYSESRMGTHGTQPWGCLNLLRLADGQGRVTSLPGQWWQQNRQWVVDSVHWRCSDRPLSRGPDPEGSHWDLCPTPNPDCVWGGSSSPCSLTQDHPDFSWRLWQGKC